MRTHCIKCGNVFRHQTHPGPYAQGDTYTEAGRRETQISGYCEYCFDDLFAGYDDEEEPRDDDDVDGDEWDGGRYDYLDNLHNHDGRDD